MRPNTTTRGLDIALCASCDRCRLRKTKCDGKRPCGNCAANYKKKNRLESIDDVPLHLIGCVYSRAKRRGPVPGKAGQVRKADSMEQIAAKRNANLLELGNMGAEGNNMMMNQQAQLTSLGGAGGLVGLKDPSGAVPSNAKGMNDAMALHRNFLLQQSNLGRAGMQSSRSAVSALDKSELMSSQDQMNFLQQQIQLQQQQIAYDEMLKEMCPQTKKPNTADYQKSNSANTSTSNNSSVAAGSTPTPQTNSGVENIVAKHLSLLDKSSIDGNRLRSYYELGIDGLNRLPPVPSDEEFCSRLGGAMNPSMLPSFDLAALRSARFAEIALGALINDQVAISLELSEATVTCLRQCVEHPIHPNCVYDVARAYYLHGLFRFYRGDLVRYFKYRLVCLTHLSQTDAVLGMDAFLAAISFHDSLVYMMYNANEGALPDINKTIPPLSNECDLEKVTAAEKKYGISTNTRAVISASRNQMWIQGVPPVFINNEAPPLSRCLDALACAIRSCCDQAQCRLIGTGDHMKVSAPKSLTALAVAKHEKELCSRNMILSAFTLLQQHESHILNIDKNQGHHLLIAALDAFLESGDEGEAGGLSDSQIQSVLYVCNTAIEHPYVLYQPGPTYHLVNNAAIFLCHLLNGLFENGNASGKSFGGMEAALFDAVLDTYLSVRKILNMHRSKLPKSLRCHCLPRPNLLRGVPNEEGAASFIELSCTTLCKVNGCQTFVLKGCSPLVAAERLQLEKEETLVESANAESQLLPETKPSDVNNETDMGDDSLLNIVGKIISS